MKMKIYFSGAEDRFGELVDSVLFRSDVMTSFVKVGQEKGEHFKRFKRICKSRKEQTDEQTDKRGGTKAGVRKKSMPRKGKEA